MICGMHGRIVQVGEGRGRGGKVEEGCTMSKGCRWRGGRGRREQEEA